MTYPTLAQHDRIKAKNSNGRRRCAHCQDVIPEGGTVYHDASRAQWWCWECYRDSCGLKGKHGKVYRFIEDPGHGWLEVPLRELVELGISQDISAFSYMSRAGGQASETMVYLEEDCDAPRFDQAKGSKNWELEPVYQDPTFVRQLPSYQAPPPAEPEEDEADPLEDFEPLDAEQREALRLKLEADEDEARTLQAGDAFMLSPLDERGWKV